MGEAVSEEGRTKLGPHDAKEAKRGDKTDLIQQKH